MTDDPIKNLRIFAALPNSPWYENNLLTALAKFGEVINYTWDPDYNRNDPQWHTHSRQKMSIDIFEQVQKAHNEKPIDIFFSCLSGRLISTGIIRAITLAGIPTLNLALKDPTEFFGSIEPTGFSGSVDIAGAYTLNWTTAKEAVDKYRQVNANVIFMPPAASPDFCKSKDVPRDIDVSFIGGKKGIKPVIVDYLRTHGINIHTYGSGWETDQISAEKAIDIINHSKITLEIQTADNVNQVEYLSRCFEITMCGGFLIAQDSPELEESFEIGKEIILYNSLEDLLGKIRYYLAHPQEAAQVRKAGLAKSLASHTWEQRFNTAFYNMGISIPNIKQNEKVLETKSLLPETLFDKILKRYNRALEKYSLAEFPRLEAYIEQILTAFPRENAVFSHTPLRTIDLASKKSKETGNKKVILFLSVFPRVDMAKKADALIKTGKYRTKLLCTKVDTGKTLDYMEEFYEDIYHFSTWQELLCYLVELMPDVIISRSRDQIATLAVIFGNAPVILNLYDMLTGVKTDNMLAVEAEKFCFLNSAGVIHKSRPNAIDKYVRPICNVQAPVLHFYPFCWDRYLVPENIKKLSDEDGVPRLVYTGIVTLSNTDKLTRGHDQLAPIIKAITIQNIYCHIYYNPETGVKDNYYQEYFDLAEKDTYFTFHSPLPSDKLNHAIAKYDYGFIIHDIRGTLTSDIECDISTANKVFTYLEAGLPIIVGNTFRAVADFVEEYKIGLVVDPTDLSGLSKTLQTIDYKELKRNVIRARNGLSIDNNIYKLDQFIESILNKP